MPGRLPAILQNNLSISQGHSAICCQKKISWPCLLAIFSHYRSSSRRVGQGGRGGGYENVLGAGGGQCLYPGFKGVEGMGTARMTDWLIRQAYRYTAMLSGQSQDCRACLAIIHKRRDRHLCLEIICAEKIHMQKTASSRWQKSSAKGNWQVLELWHMPSNLTSMWHMQSPNLISWSQTLVIHWWCSIPSTPLKQGEKHCTSNKGPEEKS